MPLARAPLPTVGQPALLGGNQHQPNRLAAADRRLLGKVAVRAGLAADTHETHLVPPGRSQGSRDG